MGRTRLEAFSDAVIAIIITIMVLDLRPPSTPTLGALLPVLPVFVSYILSFVYIGIYWNNHHHLLHLCPKVNGRILWANLHLLFWLSLFPFMTAWLGENHFAALPALLYGIVLLAAALAYWLLQRQIIAFQGAQSQLRAVLGRDWKGNASPVFYTLGIGAAALGHPWPALAMYVLVAFLWLVPDRRIERALQENASE
ncbi:DUF1211 domain-containing protein [Acidithiobacillus sp. CV18-2]|uniref:DUF1211 domain-containing protein n=1 Tax=Igneacidithiobacillus copahuensis TaxID=2724909 RepID=A0AAE2YPT2_9PROT|nr:TMEM175 family protein [Igneacidithiobacillus copahuensis]MBU2755519.1 DUF1211 domain-containing protein [Acidithiobacillus sp. CV18-3]MBU2757810.1 DUF1211 domain-containing protein [Acidithiobacillus sp. BN09-2]MBU2777925.1 DUF1211 domain-containing protein [Acidithiobacillus sp. CV18-2]MBU2797851.1 DUF1211 domain-containing protein [Acidithiobacillus sp. VAN18-2]MBU2799303.1 DUF1211 domain-containing protein [Acidithiobacillus sp. VAN18-4]UTV80639.1 TMEM175 family protein [Acidithiobacil